MARDARSDRRLGLDAGWLLVGYCAGMGLGREIETIGRSAGNRPSYIPLACPATGFQLVGGRAKRACHHRVGGKEITAQC